VSTLEIVVAVLRGTHVAALVSLFGALLFLTLVVPTAMTEVAVEAPWLRGLLLRLTRISGVSALIIGVAWLVVESAAGWSANASVVNDGGAITANTRLAAVSSVGGGPFSSQSNWTASGAGQVVTSAPHQAPHITSNVRISYGWQALPGG
jgi:hypothetical protein